MSISRLLDALYARAHVGHALHDDLEHLLFAEDVADHDTLQQHGRRPADVTRLDTKRLRPCEVRLDREDRLLWHGLDGWVEDAVDTAHDVSNVVRLSAQGVEALTVDAHHEGLVRARKDIEVVAGTRRFRVDKRPDVVDLLLRMGHDLAVDRFVEAGHDVPDLCHRRVIVGVGTDLDGEGAGVDVDDLVPGQGTSDVPAHVFDPRYRPKLAA